MSSTGPGHSLLGLFEETTPKGQGRRERMLRGKRCGLYQWTPVPLAFSCFWLLETLTRDGRTENKIRVLFPLALPRDDVVLGCCVDVSLPEVTVPLIQSFLHSSFLLGSSRLWLSSPLLASGYRIPTITVSRFLTSYTSPPFYHPL